MEEQIHAEQHDAIILPQPIQSPPQIPPLPPKINNLQELNDDCLIEIFSKMRLLHLCDVRKVCQRFKVLVDYAFVQKHNHTIDVSNYIHYTDHQITLLFKNFGSLIRHLIIKWPTNSILYQRLMNAHCPNIETLKLSSVDMTPYDLWTSTFNKLHSLSVIECRTSKSSIYRLLSRCPNLLQFKLKCSIEDVNTRANGLKMIRYATYEYSGGYARQHLTTFFQEHPELNLFELYTPPNMAMFAIQRMCFQWNRSE